MGRDVTLCGKRKMFWRILWTEPQRRGQGAKAPCKAHLNFLYLGPSSGTTTHRRVSLRFLPWGESLPGPQDPIRTRNEAKFLDSGNTETMSDCLQGYLTLCCGACGRLSGSFPTSYKRLKKSGPLWGERGFYTQEPTGLGLRNTLTAALCPHHLLLSFTGYNYNCIFRVTSAAKTSAVRNYIYTLRSTN